MEALSTITDNSPIKLHMHNLIMVIYIQYKFHEIPSIGYLEMAEDGKTDGQRQNNIPPSLVGDNNPS